MTVYELLKLLEEIPDSTEIKLAKTGASGTSKYAPIAGLAHSYAIQGEFSNPLEPVYLFTLEELKPLSRRLWVQAFRMKS
jgi:hypothetical protein